MNEQFWSWILTFVGIVGFYLAGKKVWWCWYINIANQVIWAAYSLITQQWGFLVGVLFYTFVFSKNAYEWTKEWTESRPLKGESRYANRSKYNIINKIVCLFKGHVGITVFDELESLSVTHDERGVGLHGRVKKKHRECWRCKKPMNPLE